MTIAQANKPPDHSFQQATDPPLLLTRTDCIWYRRDDMKWKCILCGWVIEYPPKYPTNPKIVPKVIETLTQAERDLVPYTGEGTVGGRKTQVL